MRLPRRVPWASLAELEQLCSWMYTDDTDTDAKLLAVNRLAAWRATTALPPALESTLALLSAVLADHAHAQQGARPTACLALRQSYAAAVIRLVNGFVDPLQLGAYARSISRIAAQLGLPAWWIELRHAATHEDLPSIEVLRAAAHEAMGWLLHNYFIPTLNPSAPPAAEKAPLRPLAPLLKQYKALLKATTRDVSLTTRYQQEISKVLREIERWLGEAKIAAGGVAALDWDADGQMDDTESDDVREKWALDRLCDALLEKGALVPVSKKKRTLSNSSFAPADTSLRIWLPLLTHLQSLHGSFPNALVFNITASLLASRQPHGPAFSSDTVLLSQEDPASYDRCLGAWANWLIDTWGVRADSEDLEDSAGPRREEVVIALATALGPGRDDLPESEGARELLLALCSKQPGMEKASSAIVPLEHRSSAKWEEQDLVVMSARLDRFLGCAGVGRVSISSDVPATARNVEGGVIPSGWRVRLGGEQEGWKACPLGVFVDS